MSREEDRVSGTGRVRIKTPVEAVDAQLVAETEVRAVGSPPGKARQGARPSQEIDIANPMAGEIVKQVG
jgi:hypothetical protein